MCEHPSSPVWGMYVEQRVRVERLEHAISQSNAEIEQTLAQAIGGYPWYKDDQRNFPGATDADGVCVGEHVPESLALEAANLIRELRREIADLREDIATMEQREDERRGER